MKRLLLVLFFISGIGLWSREQTLLAAWTFDTLTASPNTPKTYPAGLGFQALVACLYSDGTNGASYWNSSELNSFAGTIINDPRAGSAVAGKAYSLQNTTANGKGMVLKFSMTGHQGAVLTYATQRTSTGFTSQQWAFSIDSVTFTNAGPPVSPPGSFATQTLDLSGIPQMNGAAKVWLRMTVTGAASASGNNRLDNMVINALPLISVPVKLAVININGGSAPVAGDPFNVVVQAQDAGNTAANVTSDVGVVLVSNTGTLGGTLSGTIPAGQSMVNFNSVTMTEGYGQIITAHQISGTPTLTDGNSFPFNVISSTPDYRTKISGNWNSAVTWQIRIAGNWYDAWDYPDTANKSATILTGHSVKVTDNSGQCSNLIINNGGRLWNNNSSAAYFVDIYGDIANDGTIGSSDGGITKDLISFNIDGPNCTISGNGIFDAGRISKNSTVAPVTDLIVNLSVTLRYTSVSDAALCNAQSATTILNITIKPGYMISCPDSKIDLTGCTLSLESDMTGTAGIIDNGTITNNTNVMVGRFLTGYSSPDDSKYHILSSPVNAQAIQPGFVNNPPNAMDDFYKWDEPTATWINSKNIAGNWNVTFENNFIPGCGYLVAYPSDAIKIFNGSLNTYPPGSPLILACSWTDPSAGGSGGWNMCGNPFPSSVDWDLVAKGDGIDNALYYYDPVIENYRYYIKYLPGFSAGSGSRFIPPGQGFLVHANNAGPNKIISFDNTMRSGNGLSGWYKDCHVNPENYFLLKVDDGTWGDETVVLFLDQAGPGFDGKYDALKLTSLNAGVPELYTTTPDNIHLAINSIAEPVIKTAVPLGFKPGTDGNYSLILNEGQSRISGIPVILEDVKTGKIQDLAENPVYTFTSSTGDDHNRFLLHFPGISGMYDPGKGRNIHVYSFDHMIMVKRSNLSPGGKAFVYNLSGDIVESSGLSDQSFTYIDMKGFSGYFIVRVINGGEFSVVKIFLE